MDIVVLGLTIGMGGALLAVGLVLIYKANRVINLAHGELGAFTVAVMLALFHNAHWDYWPALGMSLLSTAVLAAGVERIVLRRLFRSPRLILLIATIGIAQLIIVLRLIIPRPRIAAGELAGFFGGGQDFPVPIHFEPIEFGSIVLQPGHIIALIVGPLLALAVYAFLRWSRYGVALRAAAENAQRARLLGIPVRRVSTIAWVVAGLLSGVAAVLLAPIIGFASTEAVGLPLLMRGLAAATIARMESVPVAFAVGLGLGVVDQVVFFWTGQSSLTSWCSSSSCWARCCCAAAPGAGPGPPTTRRGRRPSRSGPCPWRSPAIPAGAASSWAAWDRAGHRRDPPVRPRPVDHVPAGHDLPGVGGGGVDDGADRLGGSDVAGPVGDRRRGWRLRVAAGGRDAAAVLGGLRDRRRPGRCAALLLGLPALRLEGASLAVATLAFALSAELWLFKQPWFAADGFFPRPVYMTNRIYYGVGLAFLVAALVVVRALRDSRVGRNMIAVRDNPAQAASMGSASCGRSSGRSRSRGSSPPRPGSCGPRAWGWPTAWSFPSIRSLTDRGRGRDRRAGVPSRGHPRRLLPARDPVPLRPDLASTSGCSPRASAC